jgi:hypothetical protein
LFLVEERDDPIQLAMLHSLRASRMLLAHFALANVDRRLGHVPVGSCPDLRVK